MLSCRQASGPVKILIYKVSDDAGDWCRIHTQVQRGMRWRGRRALATRLATRQQDVWDAFANKEVPLWQVQLVC